MVLALAASAWAPRRAHAGAQQFEPLADSVRGALASRIADRNPPMRHFNDGPARDAYERWLAEMSHRLQTRVPQLRMRTDLLQSLDYEATRAALDRQLVLGLIQVESNFRKYAISSAGARGLMQVMPFWAGLIGDGDVARLFDLRTNLRYGCVILRHYLEIEQGDLARALGRYNGSVGQSAYPDAVFAAWQANWRFDPV